MVFERRACNTRPQCWRRYLSMNRISILPTQIAALHNLQHLCVSRSLSGLPLFTETATSTGMQTTTTSATSPVDCADPLHLSHCTNKHLSRFLAGLL